MKTCSNSDCKQVNPQPLIAFSKDKSRKDGFQIRCKNCNATYAMGHKKQKAATRAIWYEKNKEILAAERAENKDKILTYNTSYRKKKKEEIALQRIGYRSTRKEEISLYNSDYAKANPGKINAKTAKRRAIILQATPIGLTKKDFKKIEGVYVEAALLTEKTDIERSVDHIIPLQGENVSGLHVPWNLQILTASENSSKGNKFDFTYSNNSWSLALILVQS